MRLRAEYLTQGRSNSLTVVTNAKAFVVEGVEYDNLDGGTYGHDVRLYVPLSVFEAVSLKNQVILTDLIRDDLNKIARNVPNEFVRAVHLELDDEEDPDFQSAVGLSGRPEIDPASLEFWQPGLVRVFISHRDGHKAKAHELAEVLTQYGISSFVAHEQIAPMKEWRKEIMNGLRTMEVMVVFLTDDFEKSSWTNQEVGFALGANIPIISLKLEKTDPPGFVSHEQALRGSIDEPARSASALFQMIAGVIGAEDRLTDALIASFLASADFSETKDRFDRMKRVVLKLSLEQAMTIADGFGKNDQLYRAGHLTSHYQRLTFWLKQMTGREFGIEGKILSLRSPEPEPLEDDVPW